MHCMNSCAFAFFTVYICSATNWTILAQKDLVSFTRTLLLPSQPPKKISFHLIVKYWICFVFSSYFLASMTSMFQTYFDKNWSLEIGGARRVTLVLGKLLHNYKIGPCVDSLLDSCLLIGMHILPSRQIKDQILVNRL